MNLIMGHPIVAVPVILLHAGVGVAYTYSQGFGWPSIYILVLLGWVGSCYKEVARYRAWEREWNALDPHYMPPRPLHNFARGVAVLLVAGAIYWLAANFNDPSSPGRLIAVGLPVALLGAGLVRTVFRRRKRGAASQDWIVTQAITRPLPAPRAADAYARLPDYCRPLFTSEPQRKEQP